MIRELGESIGNTVVESVGRAVGRSQERRPLPADLLESDDAYLAVFDMPGVEREDVQVRFEDERVLVRADRFRDFHEGFEMRFPGRGLSFDGQVSLPEGASVDPDGASATLKRNGTLHVHVPKRDYVAEEGTTSAEDHGADETASFDDADEDADEE
jgi:HSP20 family molecular chaperone IbpA